MFIALTMKIVSAILYVRRIDMTNRRTLIATPFATMRRGLLYTNIYKYNIIKLNISLLMKKGVIYIVTPFDLYNYFDRNHII